MRWIIVAGTLTLAACSPQAPDGAAAPPPADAPAATVGVKVPTPEETAAIRTTDFRGPLLARGNEPFWAVRMEDTRFVVMRPDQPEVVFQAPGAEISPGKGVWRAKAADGQTLTVTLYVSACNDGMSDLAYPMVAEVEFAGQTLHGCAAKQADLDRQPKP